MPKPCICHEHKVECDCEEALVYWPPPKPTWLSTRLARLRFWWDRRAAKLMGSCRKCGETKDVICYDPRSLWFYPVRKTYCPDCCPEHEFAYERWERAWCCQVCGDHAPHDFWAYHPDN